MFYIRFISSNQETDRFLETISLFHVKNNVYHIEPHTFRVYTTLSQTPVDSVIQLIRFGDSIDWSEFERPNDSLIYKSVLVSNYPDDSVIRQHYKVTEYYEECAAHQTFLEFIHHPERESRDEIYKRLFQQSISTVLSKRDVRFAGPNKPKRLNL